MPKLLSNCWPIETVRDNKIYSVSKPFSFVVISEMALDDTYSLEVAIERLITSYKGTETEKCTAPWGWEVRFLRKELSFD